ncbi:MAG: amidohydrolase family protein [Rhodospirillales bacterium]|nr:amidohydrolase family protein [Rhodospirillales bacterium]
MRIIDSHFHWWPRSIFEQLCKRKSFPKAEKNGKGGYNYWREEITDARFNVGAEWFDLDKQFEHMEGLEQDVDVDVVSSIGPFSVHFSDLPAEEGRDAAMAWNEEMAGAQKEYSGRFWGSGAVSLVDTEMAIETADHAINDLGLMGINLPGSVGSDPRIDAERLEPFYDRIEELGVPLFIHPTDGIFPEILDGYDGALYLSLGRVIDVSVTGMRLILSGIMERHPDLKIVISHTGGALPYQAGRMDKNSKKAKLPQLPSTYIKRMYTDTVTPHMEGMKFAIEYYGVDHVMYGTDYPCWSPAAALEYFAQIGLSKEDQEKIFYSNARRILNLKDPAQAQPSKEAA